MKAQAFTTPAPSTRKPEALIDDGGRISPGWTTVLGSATGLAFGPSALMVFCFGTFVTPLAVEFGWSIGAVSAGATIISIMIMLTALVQGRLVDRFGGRRLALVSIPLMGAGFAAMALLPASIAVFYAACVLLPLLALGAWPISYLKLTAAWFERRLGLALGLANAGIGVGAALMPLLASYAIAHYGWRSAYVVLAVLAVGITWPVAWFCLRERTVPAGAPRPAAAADGADFKIARCDRNFWLAAGGFLLLGTASSTAVVHQSRILIDLGMPLQQAAAMQALLGVALIAGRIVTGWLLDRVAVSILMGSFAAFAAAAMAALALGAPGGSAPACAAVMGFVIGAEFDVLSYLIPRYFGRKAFGAIYGAIFAVFQLSSAVSIGLVGMQRSTAGSYAAALWVIAALMIPCAVCFARLGPYLTAAVRPAQEAERLVAG